MSSDTPDIPLSYRYVFAFEDGTEKVFDLHLHPDTLELLRENHAAPPEWTRLDYYPCENCPLIGHVEYCPIAVNFATLVAEFHQTVSYEKTTVTVTAPERTYRKETTVQKGLSSILGIYMTTSNCPIMDDLRPMARFHLPFATPTETLYRAVSAYLTAQFFVMREGKEPDWALTSLVDIYKKVSKVNEGFSKRISHASKKDANVNAVIILHSFGESIPFYIEHGLSEIGFLFSKSMRGKQE
ncbi:MAG: hypothetical protein NTV54_14330 [Ignavibacteriales bacterium]|nr:hypothetical protein [Ignavibacteriales bacterium]